MRNPAYLALSRHGIFYFRYPLQPGSTLRLSLRTRIPALALSLARALAILASDEVSKLAQGQIGLDELRALMAKHFESSRSKYREQVAERGPRLEVELETYEEFIALHKRGALLPSWNDGAFEEYLTRRKVPLQKGDQHYAELQREHAEHSIAYRQFIVDHDRALKTGEALPATAAAKGTASQKSKIKLSLLVREFHDYNVKQSIWRGATAKERERHLELLSELLGGDPFAADVDDEDARRVRDMLLAMPSNRNKKQATRGLDINAQANVDAAEAPRMQPRTVRSTCRPTGRCSLGLLARGAFPPTRSRGLVL